MRIAHVSTLPDMRCGIAIYASDLIEALPGHDHRRFALHYGQNLTPDTAGDCNVRDFRAVAALAESINASDAEVVCLQHEFGIWGGLNGPHLFDFLDALDRPVVSTIHTTFARGAWPAIRLHGLRTLIGRSGTTFVLSESSRRTLCEALAIPTSRIGVLPHGVPAVGLAPPAPLTDEAGTQRWRFCSLGFFRPDKGLDVILEALAALRRDGVRFRYVIAGEAQQQFDGQGDYRDRIVARIEQLGLDRRVKLVPRFLSRDEQMALIGRSHAGLFAYQNPAHASSGPMPMVLAAGTPVVCTPFEFACDKAAAGPGVILAQGFAAADFEAALRRLISTAEDLPGLGEDLYRRTRDWTWPKVGARYDAALRSAAAPAP